MHVYNVGGVKWYFPKFLFYSPPPPFPAPPLNTVWKAVWLHQNNGNSETGSTDAETGMDLDPAPPWPASSIWCMQDLPNTTMTNFLYQQRQICLVCSQVCCSILTGTQMRTKKLQEGQTRTSTFTSTLRCDHRPGLSLPVYLHWSRTFHVFTINI